MVVVLWLSFVGSVVGQGVDQVCRWRADGAVADLAVTEFDDPPGPVGTSGEVDGDERQGQGGDGGPQQGEVEVVWW